MRRFIWIGLLFVSLIVSGCSKAGFQETVVYEQGRDYVMLLHETDKEGQTLDKDFEHPAQFSPEQIDEMLGALHYSQYTFFKWRGNKQVFIESERQKLSKHISQALAAADSDHWISFAVTAKKRDLLLPTRRITDGFIFILDGQLNLVLANLNFELSDIDDPFSGDPRDRYTLGTLRFIEAAGMTYPPVDMADPQLKRPHQNWIIIDYPKMTAAPAAAEIVKTEAPEPAVSEAAVAAPVETPDATKTAAPEKTVEQRLSELKSIFDKGLISAEDYEAKKRTLLDEL